MKTYFIIAIQIIVSLECLSQVNETKPHFVGEKYGGGVIFYLDPTGMHGLIAKRYDEKFTACWGNNGDFGASFMNEGARNTEIIAAFMKTRQWKNCEMPAACICDTSTYAGFTDWYLPSINELKQVYDNQQLIGNFSAWDYCSSTESSKKDCWNIHFKPHKRIIYHYKKSYSRYYIRCIRKF